MVSVFCFVGFSGTGKTTLLEKVVAQLRDHGLRVAAVKHDAHDFAVDQPGKDTWRLAQAGASTVVISSPKKMALMRQVEREASLDELVAMAEGQADIVLVEGYKGAKGFRKVVVLGEDPQQGPIVEPAELLAVVSRKPVPGTTPCFHPDDAAGLVALLLREAATTKGRDRIS